MGRYLSMDTEATGIEENSQLINLAFVPVDVTGGKVVEELGWEVLVRCPSFEELKPGLNDWVKENLEVLLRKAHSEGIPLQECRIKLEQYLKSTEISSFFGRERPVLLGKSLSALDIPLLTRSFGWDWVQRYFYHHTVDITCLARSLEDTGILPKGCTSTTLLMRYFKIREGAKHTAMSDAVDMGVIYLKLVELVRGRTMQTPSAG